MWEHEKELLDAYRSCWSGVREEVGAGQVPDVLACKDETEQLISYTIRLMNFASDKHKAVTPENIHALREPRLPYFESI